VALQRSQPLAIWGFLQEVLSGWLVLGPEEVFVMVSRLVEIMASPLMKTMASLAELILPFQRAGAILPC
jgi:hypothetical protein